MAEASISSGAKVPLPVFVRDRMARAVAKRKLLLGSILCGVAMAWVTLAACSVRTPLSRWSLLLAVCVVVLSLVHVRIGAVTMGLVCTVQMLSLSGQAGIVTGLLSILFVVLCGHQAGRFCGVLIAPYLVGLHLGLAAVLGLALTASRRVGWVWVGLALTWCLLHGLAVGHPRLGVAPLPQLAEAASRAQPKTVQLDGAWLRKVLSQADMEGLKDSVLRVVADPARSVPWGLQLLLWCGIAFTARALYHHRRRKDRIAMEYIEKVTRHTERIPPHRRMAGVVIVGALLFIVSYIILGAFSRSVEYGFFLVVMDVLAAALAFVPLWVMLEGDPVAGRESLAERREAHGVTLKDLPVGDGDRHRRADGPREPGGSAAARPAAAKAPGGPASRPGGLPPWLRQGPSAAGAHHLPAGPPTHGGAKGALAAAIAEADGNATARSPEAGAPGVAVEAIVFIDMVGSTSLGSKYGDEYVLGLKEKLGQIVRAESARQHVLFAKGTGDGFMLTFPEALNAVRAGVGIMRQVKTANQGLPESRSIHLRMGMHLGQINIDSHGDRIGTAANFAARIEATKLEQLQAAEDPDNVVLPEKDRILVSDVVADELKGQPEFLLRPIGYFEFKGITGLHRIFELRPA